jgi:hypothetical protein
MEHIFCGPSFIKQKSAQRDLLVTEGTVLTKILIMKVYSAVIKYAKFKSNKKSVGVLVPQFFHGTHIHILRNTSVPRNIVWETLLLY